MPGFVRTIALCYVKATRTNDDIVERLVRDLVNCGEHRRKDEMVETTARRGAAAGSPPYY